MRASATGTGAERPPGGSFRFDAGAVRLDFAHTGGEGRYAMFETLREPADLGEWLAQPPLAAVMTVPVTAASWPGRFRAHPRVRERRLPSAVRGLVPPRRSALARDGAVRQPRQAPGPPRPADHEPLTQPQARRTLSTTPPRAPRTMATRRDGDVRDPTAVAPSHASGTATAQDAERSEALANREQTPHTGCSYAVAVVEVRGIEPRSRCLVPESATSVGSGRLSGRPAPEPSGWTTVRHGGVPRRL